MRTSKEELISNELKPIICQKIKDARIKFGYSLEDLAKSITNFSASAISKYFFILPLNSVTLTVFIIKYFFLNDLE